MEAIEVTGLRKTYRGKEAVAGIDLVVARGEIFALLGPNGAGKTTTVEILEGHRKRDAGTVRVLGHDPATGGPAYRSKIGVVLQSAGFEEEFTVRELVRLQTALFPRGHDPDELIRSPRSSLSRSRSLSWPSSPRSSAISAPRPACR